MHKRWTNILSVCLVSGFCLFAIPVKGALIFDGTNDYISVKRDLSGGLGAVTVCGWVLGFQQANIFCFSGNSVLLHFVQGVGFYLVGADGKPSEYLNWSPVPAQGKWQFVAATWSNPANGDGKMKLYLNGIKQKQELAYGGGSNGVLRSAGEMTIGNKFNSGIVYFKGMMEDVRVYNQALSSNEVLKVYNSVGCDGITNGLTLRFLLNGNKNGQPAEGTNTIIDVSGNGNNGTPKGSPVYWSVPAEEIAKVEKARERTAVYFKENDAKITAPFKPRYDELNQVLEIIKADGLSQIDSLFQQYKILETKLKFEALLAD